MLEFIPRFTLLDFLDILIVAFIIYRILIYLSRTRAMKILFGMMILLALSVFAKFFNLYTLSFIFNNFVTVFIFALVVIFQPEVRRILARLGERHFGVFTSKLEAERTIEEIVRACARMSEDRIGGIIVLEREAHVDGYVDAGVRVDASVSKELIVSIFWPGTPLHDGAIVIRGDRLLIAGAFLPLSLNPELPQILGTRHRAGIGITEETDAIAVVVSEETGDISVARNGKLIEDVDPHRLKRMLMGMLTGKKQKSFKDIIFEVLRGDMIETHS